MWQVASLRRLTAALLLAGAAAVGTSGCIVAPIPAPVAVEPAPVVIAPRPVIVTPRFHRGGYYGYGHGYRYWR
jgi:hypothetical protein